MAIDDLTIVVTAASPGPLLPMPVITLLDNPEDIQIHRLSVVDPLYRTLGAAPMIMALTESFTIGRFEYNGATAIPLVPQGGELVVPDQVTTATVAGRPRITAVSYWTQRAIGDGIAWWNLTKPATGLNAEPSIEISETRAPGEAFTPATVPFAETYDGAVTGLMFSGRPIQHGRGYRGAIARILARNGVGSGGEAVAQIGVPLRRGARLDIELPQGGSVFDVEVGPGGAVRLSSAGGRWHAAAQR